MGFFDSGCHLTLWKVLLHVLKQSSYSSLQPCGTVPTALNLELCWRIFLLGSRRRFLPFSFCPSFLWQLLPPRSHSVFSSWSFPDPQNSWAKQIFKVDQIGPYKAQGVMFAILLSFFEWYTKLHILFYWFDFRQIHKNSGLFNGINESFLHRMILSLFLSIFI